MHLFFVVFVGEAVWLSFPCSSASEEENETVFLNDVSSWDGLITKE